MFKIKSSNLILLLTFYFGFVINLSFWRFIIERLEITGFSSVLFVFSLLFFIAVPFFLIFNLVVLPYLAKPIVITFLILSGIANYAMFSLGAFIDTDMLTNAFETNAREAFDLVTIRGFLWVLAFGIIPALWLGFTKITYQSFKKEFWRRLLLSLVGFTILGVSAAGSYKQYMSFGRNNREVRKLINTVNYTYSTIRYFQLKALANREFKTLDKEAVLAPYGDNIPTVLVLVVGETARAKNFSLYGYEKDTNPKLAKQDIISFDDVASCGTATAVSLPCIFSHETRKDFDTVDAKYIENLLDVLQTAGYDIIWKDNDDGCKGVCNRVKTEHMVRKGNKKFCFKDYCHDEVLLDGLDDILKNIKKNTLIVLHMMGSHGPTYYNRYPDEFKVFQPTCDTADIQNCSKEEIINTYDNTILYTDHVLAGTIDILKQFPEHEAGLIYVSDHGESLGENNIYLHGLPYNIAPDEQKEVPLILWMSENMKKYDYVDYACMKKEADTNSYTHDNMFHSILGLLEVKSKLYDADFDIFHNCRTKPLPF